MCDRKRSTRPSVTCSRARRKRRTVCWSPRALFPDSFRFADKSPRTSSLRFPEPVCAGIVPRAALFSEGGWDAFSKTPTASNSVICFRVELHLGAEPTRHSGADSRTAKALCSSCGDRWRNGNGKSDRNRRILLPSQRSESAGALVPATPGSLAHTNELRGIPLAARGRTHRFRSIQGDERLFRGYPEGLDAELSSPGSRQNGGPATSCGNRGQD